jgi:hypothetical protein
MKLKWNVNPNHPTTIARLISELEGVSYLLDCLGDEDIEHINDMKKKYYKKYFKVLKEQ